MDQPSDTGEAAPDRCLVTLTGRDALPFLQSLVTNDVLPLGKGPGIVWTALLSPQGKYLADFFVVNTGEALLLDLPSGLAEATRRRLSMYRLRADVTLSDSALHPRRGLGPAPGGALPDPRHPALGWRAYTATPGGPALSGWDAIRVEHLIPEAETDLVPDDSYILEMGFERLHGVDFRKGCYVGQEVTARMKHKTELRKGLVRVAVTGHAEPGTPILADGREAGRLGTRAADRALAWLRLDRAAMPLSAGDASVVPE